MTAEIAILNKEAIALASDSAVTYGGENNLKIFSSANKLFELSKFQPIGVMVYGNADLIGVPWETIIKYYRNHNLKEKSFDNLKDYAEDFIKFLDKENLLFSKSMQDRNFRFKIYFFYRFILDEINTELFKAIQKRKKTGQNDLTNIISTVINDHFKKWDKTKNIQSIPDDFNESLVEKYKTDIDIAIDMVFENYDISPINRKKLQRIAGSLFSKFPEGSKFPESSGNPKSGLVIAGFGKLDIFPAFVHLEINGIVENRLLYRQVEYVKIDENQKAGIYPFAQEEMVDRFIDGVDPEYLKFEDNYLGEIFKKYERTIIKSCREFNEIEKEKLRKKLLKIGKTAKSEFIENSDKFIDKYFLDPIYTVVEVLPKSEMAALAEALVNITSLKRKVTMQQTESVSGPVDVAIISKGDGFVWIKRKLYFDPNLNPQFFKNKFIEGVENDK